MSDLLQLVGSMITGATIFLMLITFYLGVGDTAGTQVLTTMVHESSLTATDIMERDIRKAGLRVADSTYFLRADSISVSFRADDDDNGTPDTLTYGLAGAFSSLSGLQSNTLYRQRGNGSPVPELTGVTLFKMQFLDAAGAQTTTLKNIRIVSVSLTATAPAPSAGSTPGISWVRTIRPRNVR
jgi:hypothetical protein